MRTTRGRYRVVVAGAPEVGKTSLLVKFAFDEFPAVQTISDDPPTVVPVIIKADDAPVQASLCLVTLESVLPFLVTLSSMIQQVQRNLEPLQKAFMMVLMLC